MILRKKSMINITILKRVKKKILLYMQYKFGREYKRNIQFFNKILK